MQIYEDRYSTWDSNEGNDDQGKSHLLGSCFGGGSVAIWARL